MNKGENGTDVVEWTANEKCSGPWENERREWCISSVGRSSLLVGSNVLDLGEGSGGVVNEEAK